MTCAAIGYLIVGGRKAGLVKCELEAGHNVSVGRLDNVESLRIARERVERGQPFGATPHRFTLEWPDDVAMLDDWPEAYDPDEPTDVVVPIVNVEEV